MVSDSFPRDTDSGHSAVRIRAVTGPGPALNAVRELLTEYARGVGLEPCLKGFDSEVAGLPGEYAPPGGVLLLAELGTRPVGCIALRRLDATRCEMKRLFVRPAFRAAGIARMLAEALIEHARALGYHELLLDTLPSMRSARLLYESLGFEPCGPYLPEPTPEADCYALAL